MCQCRVSVTEGGPPLNQHWVSAMDGSKIQNATFDN